MLQVLQFFSPPPIAIGCMICNITPIEAAETKQTQVSDNSTEAMAMVKTTVLHETKRFVVFVREYAEGETVYDLKDKATGEVTYTWAIDPLDAYRCVLDAERSLAA